MSAFSADWLALREPLDSASRDAGLTDRLFADLIRGQPQPASLNIVDLGAGTGANLRYIAPRLNGIQDWLLVENDPALLAAMEGCMRTWRADVVPHHHSFVIRAEHFECWVQPLALDLATQLEQLGVTGSALLTASALLDLVSLDWLQRLVGLAAQAGAAVLFALTYDGRIDCQPAEPEDGEIRTLVNQHQQRDKGFGLALGPTAGPVAVQVLQQHGYRTECAASDWQIGPDMRHLQYALVEGWFTAACEVAPQRATALEGWLQRRCEHILHSRSQLCVGHIDITGRLPTP